MTTLTIHDELVWMRPAATRRGQRSLRWGGGLVGLMVVLWLFGPMIASDQPIVCRHQGVLYFPGVVDSIRNVPLVGGWPARWGLGKSRPFSLPGFDAKRDLDPEAFAIWPLIPFGPFEFTDEALASPSWRHWLGTDDRGRDVASRLVRGVGISLRVAAGASFIAALLGVLIGGLAGYVGGWLDQVLSRVIEAFLCFPAFVLILAIVAIAGANLTQVMIVIGVVSWPAVARLVRAEVLRIRSAEYVSAARVGGASTGRILVRHVLPGALAPAGVMLACGAADAILIEAGLSWLSFGAPGSWPSWGNMLRSGYDQLRSAPHLIYPPSVALFVAVVAFHLLSDGLRARFGSGGRWEYR